MLYWQIMTKRLILILLFVVSSVCMAQFDGSVLGTVTDPAGLAVTGAKVKLVNTQTGVSESTGTDGDGGYRFLSVPVGRYTVIVQAAGFQTGHDYGGSERRRKAGFRHWQTLYGAQRFGPGRARTVGYLLV